MKQVYRKLQNCTTVHAKNVVLYNYQRLELRPYEMFSFGAITMSPSGNVPGLEEPCHETPRKIQKHQTNQLLKLT